MDGHHTVNVDHVRLELLGFSYLHNVACVFLVHSHCAHINSNVGSVGKQMCILSLCRRIHKAQQTGERRKSLIEKRQNTQNKCSEKSAIFG